MNDTITVIPSGYGHVILDPVNNKTWITSSDAAGNLIDCLCASLTVAVDMLSEILQIPSEYIYRDLYTLSGCDVMEEAVNAVLRKQGKEVHIPCLTETAFNAVKEVLQQKGAGIHEE